MYASSVDQRFIDASHSYSRIGGACSVMIGIWMTLNMVFSVLVMTLFPMNSYPSWVIMLLSDIPLFCAAIPVAYLIMQRIPELPVTRFSMRPGRFIELLIMCVPLMYCGSIMGNLFSEIFSGGTSQNRLETIIDDSNIASTLFFVVLLAPIIEEWFFRKQIISRLRVFGEKSAIIFSALAFALFHVNVYQFFYAFALGLMFGYVYTRTSCLRYSIVMHIIINANGSIIAPWVINRVDLQALAAVESGEASLTANDMIVSLYSVCLIVLFFVGLALLIAKRKSFEFYETPQQLPVHTRFRATYCNLGVATFIIVCVAFAFLELFM